MPHQPFEFFFCYHYNGTMFWRGEVNGLHFAMIEVAKILIVHKI